MYRCRCCRTDTSLGRHSHKPRCRLAVSIEAATRKCCDSPIIFCQVIIDCGEIAFAISEKHINLANGNAKNTRGREGKIVVTIGIEVSGQDLPGELSSLNGTWGIQNTSAKVHQHIHAVKPAKATSGFPSPFKSAMLSNPGVGVLAHSIGDQII